MNTLTDHQLLGYAMAISFGSMVIGVLIHWLSVRLQNRDRKDAETWRRKQQDLERSTEAYRQHCEREYLRALARKVRPE